MKDKKWFPITLVVFATFFWGTTFILVKETIAVLPVNYFLFLRFGLSTLLTLPLIIYRGKLRDTQIWKQGSILGLFLFTSYYFQTVGLLFTTPANAAFITGLNIIFIPILGNIFYQYELVTKEIIAVILSFIGTVLLTINFQNLTINPGDALIILTAISIALHILSTEQYVDSSLVELLWIQFFTMTLCAGVLTLFSPAPEIVWYTSPLVVFTLVVTVVFATIFAFGAQFYAQRASISAAVIGVLFSLEPVFALAIDLIVGTVPPALTLLGMTLIFSAILLATLSSIQPEQLPEPEIHE